MLNDSETVSIHEKCSDSFLWEKVSLWISVDCVFGNNFGIAAVCFATIHGVMVCMREVVQSLSVKKGQEWLCTVCVGKDKLCTVVVTLFVLCPTIGWASVIPADLWIWSVMCSGKRSFIPKTKALFSVYTLHPILRSKEFPLTALFELLNLCRSPRAYEIW